MVRHIGDRQVRNRGTIGGSLAQGDPTGEMPLACLVLGASVRAPGRTAAGRCRWRTVPGLLRDRPRPVRGAHRDRLPARPAHFAFAEQCRRHNDFAVVSVAAVGDRGAGRHVGRCPGGPGRRRPTSRSWPGRGGRYRVGLRLPDEAIAAAAEAALEVADPPSDVRASADYRRHLVPIYVRRVLTELRSLSADASATEGMT